MVSKTRSSKSLGFEPGNFRLWIWRTIPLCQYHSCPISNTCHRPRSATSLFCLQLTFEVINYPRDNINLNIIIIKIFLVLVLVQLVRIVHTPSIAVLKLRCSLFIQQFYFNSISLHDKILDKIIQFANVYKAVGFKMSTQTWGRQSCFTLCYNPVMCYALFPAAAIPRGSHNRKPPKSVQQ